ncbi:ATP-dependent 6-phosphofructokinase 3-like [Mercurialis annua]|uniref:ATP-dependent 6-phosphofructokinase 3-like n=1 Tax=Mercurialis annua TaxID=3986 RepID=UPI00216051D3|nr:ATP-dependent 6-phosphofructokinase 3-like [Mercurialis annua]
MDSTLSPNFHSSSLNFPFLQTSAKSRTANFKFSSVCFTSRNSGSGSGFGSSITAAMSNGNGNYKPKIITGEYGYVLEDVPHLTDYLPDLPTYSNYLQDNPAYSVVKQYFVHTDDSVPQKIVVHKDSPRGTHFRRAGPRQKVYFDSDEVHACIVTCGGLCPGLNTVIREIVCGLYHMYGVTRVLGIEGGYKGFYARNTIPLSPKVVNDIHKRGGTIIGTSRGGHDTSKIVDSIQDRGINQVYIIGGDGTQKGASVIFEEIRRRGLKVIVAGIPKTIDNDIPVIDKSFGFDTAVEEAQRAINAAHVESESIENGIGLVKLMGRYSGFIAMYATLASRDVDCCLIPESPFYLDGEGGLLEYIEKRLKENGHMVIVIAEGAGQELLSEQSTLQDASGNKLLQDIGLFLSQKIKDYSKKKKMTINLKYIDPTYMIRAIPSNASDNVYCTLLAQSAVHGAMAGYTGFTSGLVNGRQTYIPFYRITEKQNKVVITDRMWARLLSSTNQPSFWSHKDEIIEKKEEVSKVVEPQDGNCTDDIVAKKEEEVVVELKNEPPGLKKCGSGGQDLEKCGVSQPEILTRSVSDTGLVEKCKSRKEQTNKKRWLNFNLTLCCHDPVQRHAYQNSKEQGNHAWKKNNTKKIQPKE